MARVAYIDEDRVDDPVVKEAYERMIAKRGKVTNIYKVLAHKPNIIKTIGPFVASVQQPDELDAKLKEKVILKVSKTNCSAYCCHAHEQIGRKMGFTDEDIQGAYDPEGAEISEEQRVALKYAQEMTVNPGGVSDEMFSEVRDHFSESQVVELTALIALYNMINRFNEALKLDPEDY